MDKEHDLFSEIVKDKLANYTLPVEDDSWDKIAERINPVSRKKSERRWIVAVAVAASVALLFLLFSIFNKTYYHETASLLSGHEETIVQDVPEKETFQSVLPQTVEPAPVIRKFKSCEQLAENNFTAEVNPVKEVPEENQKEDQVVSTNNKPGAKENQQVSPNNSYDFGKDDRTPVIKRKKRQSIRLSFGSGGNLLADNTSGIMRVPSHSPEEGPFYNLSYISAIIQEDTKVYESLTDEILLYENYPDVTHHLPLSVGISVKKEINRTFALESGIVYSYIASDFSREFPKNKAYLQLHYIGIPLNVHTRFFGNRFSPWEIYLSMGGMVEKGVLSHFVQKTYYDTVDNYVKTITSNEKIGGLQWSLNISPGIDYQIHKRYSIYLEPKLSYYFDNNQPVSARTKHPVVAGINAGIRFAW